MCTSVPHMPARCTRIRTSLMPMRGFSTSSSQRPGSFLLLTSAFMSKPYLLKDPHQMFAIAVATPLRFSITEGRPVRALAAYGELALGQGHGIGTTDLRRRRSGPRSSVLLRIGLLGMLFGLGHTCLSFRLRQRPSRAKHCMEKISGKQHIESTAILKDESRPARGRRGAIKTSPRTARGHWGADT